MCVCVRTKFSTRMNKFNKSDFMDTNMLATVRSLVGLGGDLIIHLTCSGRSIHTEHQTSMVCTKYERPYHAILLNPTGSYAPTVTDPTCRPAKIEPASSKRFSRYYGVMLRTSVLTRARAITWTSRLACRQAAMSPSQLACRQALLA